MYRTWTAGGDDPTGTPQPPRTEAGFGVDMTLASWEGVETRAAISFGSDVSRAGRRLFVRQALELWTARLAADVIRASVRSLNLGGYMTLPKPPNPDAISRKQAATLLGVGERTVRRYRRDGLLGELDGYPSYSLAEVQAILADPWLSGRQASRVLGVSHVRVSQLAKADKIPSYIAPSGRHYYRSEQLRTVANARRARLDGFPTPKAETSSSS